MFFHALSKRYKLLLSLIAQSCPLVRLGKEKTIYGHKLPYSSRSDSTRKADSLNKLPDHEIFKEDEFLTFKLQPNEIHQVHFDFFTFF